MMRRGTAWTGDAKASTKLPASSQRLQLFLNVVTHEPGRYLVSSHGSCHLPKYC